MTKAQFEARVKQIDDALGNPQMKWEGPEPHDFRNMKERGVRFVHTPLFANVPEVAWGGTDYAPDGIIYLKIAVGDEAAAAEIGGRLVAAGLPFVQCPWEHGYTLLFEVPAILTP